jgi:hypothetical protein
MFIMEMITSDGVYRIVDVSFVVKSRILADIPSGPVPVQITDKILSHLVKGTWPTDDYELLECARAADYLHIEDTLDEACQRVARRLQGKTANEIINFIGHR